MLTTAPSAEANAQENVERPAAELYRLVAAAQFAPEPAEADLAIRHRMVPIHDN